ncbi:MAG: aminoacyl-tRNA hydrolase [Verrucomicrobia bacterium]|nr:aminoacyl-tRNA hydrolase [Verrucomicrobiota bacterium]
MQDVPQMVVGLGNPGKEYVGTRHNMGFEVLDHLAAKEGVEFKSERQWKAHVAKLNGGPLLVKPQTYMNLSGRAVVAAAAFYKVPVEGILVVFDDVALPLGQLRIRLTGGAGGHNGIKSLLAELGSPDFRRLKVGIGDSGGRELSGHVLGRFREEEREEVENSLARAVEAVQVALARGVGHAANTLNVKEKPAKDKKCEPEIRESDCSEYEG